METVLIDRKTEKLIVKEVFEGGYNPPNRQQYEQEKTDRGIAECVLIQHEKPTDVDFAIEEIKQKKYADFSVQNDFDGEYNLDFEVVSKPQEEVDRVLAKREQQQLEADQREAELQQINQARNFLKNSGDPVDLPEALADQQKMKRIILYLLK